MSEKIYSLLLRLYPSHFRARYGSEALQLFRDRLRDEKGFWASVRLWSDLLLDFAVSLPQEYLSVRTEFVGAAPLHSANGVPSSNTPFAAVTANRPVASRSRSIAISTMPHG